MNSANYRFLGSILIIVGIVVTAFVANKVPQPGMFSSGRDVSGTTVVIILLTAFYHIVPVILCFGLARAIDSQMANRQAPFGEKRSEEVTESVDEPDIWVCRCRTRNPIENSHYSECGRARGAIG